MAQTTQWRQAWKAGSTVRIVVALVASIVVTALAVGLFELIEDDPNPANLILPAPSTGLFADEDDEPPEPLAGAIVDGTLRILFDVQDLGAVSYVLATIDGDTVLVFGVTFGRVW